MASRAAEPYPVHDQRTARHVVSSVPVSPRGAALRPLGFDEVQLTGGFWAERQETNFSATLAHIESWLEREGWLANFDLVPTGDLTGRRGREFSDSEVYKLLEAMAWEQGRRPDDELARRFDAIVVRVGAAQDADGYLSTKFGHAGQAARYSDLEWGHELYCQGHLMQAATACVRIGRADHPLVDIARRSADHICAVFDAAGRAVVCGHAEVEVALVELGRALTEPRYVEQARVFLERRGHHLLEDIEWGRSYYQDDVPIREADVFRGHAVRANYLAAAAVDLASELGDEDLLETIQRQWRATAARRTYVTGGQGSHHQDEAFGDDFVLPPDRAYSETCAAVGWNMVNWRLLLQTGATAYADAHERALYNVVATSPSTDGRAFYYANTLHQRMPGQEAAVDQVSRRALSSLRAPWFEVSCCPPNVARTLASLDTVLATADDHGVQLHQYAPSAVTTTVDGQGLVLSVETDFPRSGRVVVHVHDAPEQGWQLTLRVPAWSADGAQLWEPGTPPRRVPTGSVTVRGPASGEELTFELDMMPRFVRADPRVDAVRGCVAVQRGPEVWCLESLDLPQVGASIDRVLVDSSVAPSYDDGRVVVRAVVRAPFEHDETYTGLSEVPAHGGLDEVVDLPLVPYHDWARRGPSTMRVWIPETSLDAGVPA